jgi:hypothetical protein
VAIDDMFDNRKTKTCSTKFAAAVPINAVEPFGQARQMDRVNARSIINDLESDARGA